MIKLTPLDKVSKKEIIIQKALGIWPEGEIKCTFCGNNDPSTLTTRSLETCQVGLPGAPKWYTVHRYTCLPHMPCSSG